MSPIPAKAVIVEFLAVLLGLGYLFVLPLMAFVAYSRSMRHDNELAALRKELEAAQRQRDALAWRIGRLEGGAAPLATTSPEPVAAPRATDAVITPSAVEPPPEPPEAAGAKAGVAPPPTTSAVSTAASATTLASKPADEAAPEPTPPLQEPNPSLISRAVTAAREWLLGGNTFARLGMVVLFLGLAFLLRYVSERVSLPLELRYLGVAATALVGLALGWRLRLQRPAYALLMQGGAVGVLYLTVFAALKLHGQPLLPTELGFALLVVFVACAGVLAVAQDAPGLALAAALGGFAAPVLVSTGGGSHVALFSYFALLNAGILGTAWFKAWRPLNLVGFFGTFLIGLAWGLRSYEPAAHYASAQGFLLLFFLMYVSIGLLFARRMLLADEDLPADRDADAWRRWFARQGASAQRYIDATLLFGPPLAGFGMQAGLVRHIEYATAGSALALGAFYLLLTRLVLGRDAQRLRLLAEIFVALGVVFVTLTIPLALDARWTAAAWALEGAGIYWIGQRQHRPLARGFALLVQAGALLAFLRTLGHDPENLLGGSATGALLLGAAFLANQLVLGRHGRAGEFDAPAAPLFGVLACGALALIAPLCFAAPATVIAWAAGGALAVAAALRWRLAAWLSCGLLIQFGAGLLFIAKGRWGRLPGPELIDPFLHLGFAAPLGLALSALATAWRLRCFERDDAALAAPEYQAPTRVFGALALLWAALWWALAWDAEWARVLSGGASAGNLWLATIAAGAFALLALARRLAWDDALRAASLLLGAITLRLLDDGQHTRLPLLDWGWLGYGAALAASVQMLRQAPERLPEKQQRLLHLLNLWVWLAAAALFARAALAWLGDPGSAWRWLGWTLPLAVWLFHQSRPEGGQRWPCRVFPELYAGAGSAPVLGVLLAWLVAANLGSGGAAAPLPYVPLVNPLELAFAFALLAGWQWQAQLGETWAGFARASRLALLGAAFVSYSAAVLRVAHHYLPLPWQLGTLLDSMTVQAGLSLAWSLLAIALMVGGHRRAHRPLWIAGAALFGLVVVKLFLIELAQRGGLERIVSFIGVGALLLVVGYFAPLPPARDSATTEAKP